MSYLWKHQQDALDALEHELLERSQLGAAVGVELCPEGHVPDSRSRCPRVKHGAATTAG